MSSGLRLVGIISRRLVGCEVNVDVGKSVRIVGMMVGRELYAEKIV